jgi:vacuolar-type H+-ATPase subunit I/STV1
MTKSTKNNKIATNKGYFDFETSQEHLKDIERFEKLKNQINEKEKKLKKLELQSSFKFKVTQNYLNSLSFFTLKPVT